MFSKNSFSLTIYSNQCNEWIEFFLYCEREKKKWKRNDDIGVIETNAIIHMLFLYLFVSESGQQFFLFRFYSILPFVCVSYSFVVPWYKRKCIQKYVRYINVELKCLNVNSILNVLLNNHMKKKLVFITFVKKGSF